MATGIKFAVGKTDDGRWAAARSASPYFFFRADSEEEVVDIALRALAFYRDSEDTSHSAPTGRSKTLSTFYPSRIVQDDCVAA